MPTPVPPASAPLPDRVHPVELSQPAGRRAPAPQSGAKDDAALWPAQVRAGEVVEAWMGGMLRHRGVLEEIAPQIGVVWIQELGTGMRIMLDLTETDIRAHPAPPPHRG